MDRIFVAIDVETTGLDAKVDELIEVAAVKFRPGEVLETFSQLIRPHHTLPLKISQLTHITPEMLVGAPRFPEVAPELAKFVKSYPLVGHAVDFDIRMLQAQGLRLPQRAYDTLELATLLMPRLPAYRLSALSAALGIVHDEAHRALSDTDATRQVFEHLLGRIEALELNELAEIIRLTGKIEWPLRDLFEEVQRNKAKLVFVDERRPSERTSTSSSSVTFTPLKPTGDERPLDLQRVEKFFAPDGALGKSFDGYEQRQQQVDMSLAITEAFNSGDALMVEAGTGTGKGVAYLVPAAMFAAQRGERVVISTNTINLQDQLFFKDIPALQEIMAKHEFSKPKRSDPDESSVVGRRAPEPPFTAALLKGRGNYLCLHRYKQLRRDTRLTSEDIRALLKVQLWLPTTETGDKAELPFQEREGAAWGRMSAAFDMCTGPRCPDFNECYFFKARRAAESAHLVIVNHALMLADLVVEANVLPPYDHVVIDEAHNLEDVATDQFSFEVDQQRMLQFLDSLYEEGGAQVVGGLLSELQTHFRDSAATQTDMDKATAVADAIRPAVTQARGAVYDCFNLLTGFVTREAETTNYDPRLRLTPNVRKNPAWQSVEHAWDNLNLNLTTIGEGIGRIETLLGDLKDAELMEYEALVLRVQALKRFCTEARINIGAVIHGGQEELITWLNQDRQRDMLTLHAAPLAVTELLRANLFEQKSTAILTSATLSVGGGFDYVKQRIGLSEPEELLLDSPFDYEKQALVYIPSDMPEPNHPAYQRALEDAIITLCSATEGRALVLFTSNSGLRQTYRAIQEPLEDVGITVLGQGIDGSRRNLLERFKEYPRTVLLGTTSFWEGVDVVGDALSVLIIAKLPFSVPNDPIYAARSEQFSDAFAELSVPQAILRFKQGFGRLIRSKSDRGVVAVLDKRLISKKYGQTFLSSLPHTFVRTGPIKQLPGLAARFLANVPVGEASKR
ncbi:MAG: helicase C-terminal domain-containing protein [Roseiflexaceae bacterium]|nr:helicase C-terminal domain-containing protein [Roseiflexaceae bacterium]